MWLFLACMESDDVADDVTIRSPHQMMLFLLIWHSVCSATTGWTFRLLRQSYAVRICAAVARDEAYGM